MSEPMVIRNARLVLPDAVVLGSLVLRDGVIIDIAAGASSVGEDWNGDLLLPGFVELHTDQLESHYRPRPGVFWPALPALHAHDAQIVASGITTVFDAVRLGSDPDMPDMGTHVAALVDAIETGRHGGWLRAEHFLHLRCELPTPDVLTHFHRYSGMDGTRLVSLMDHTPGQRQFESMEAYKRFYGPKMGRTPAEFDAFIAARLDEHTRYSAANRQAITAAARDQGLALASHDDASSAHVAEAVADGVALAEFPTTLAAAQAAHAARLKILMGAPNIVRGGSHSGNIAAAGLIAAGLLDVLSSDYVPFALLQAVFSLADSGALPLPAAVRLVSANPAEAVGLSDRGEIALGRRADLVRIQQIGSLPVVRGVWRQGQRVG